MNKYVSKPIIVEAFQWSKNLNEENLPDWFLEARRHGVIFMHYDMYNHGNDSMYLVRHHDEKILISEGDYIIKGIFGTIFTRKPEQFELFWEKL